PLPRSSLSQQLLDQCQRFGRGKRLGPQNAVRSLKFPNLPTLGVDAAVTLDLRVGDPLPILRLHQGERASQSSMFRTRERHHLNLDVPLLPDQQELLQLTTPDSLTTQRTVQYGLLDHEAQVRRRAPGENLLTCQPS